MGWSLFRETGLNFISVVVIFHPSCSDVPNTTYRTVSVRRIIPPSSSEHSTGPIHPEERLYIFSNWTRFERCATVHSVSVRARPKRGNALLSKRVMALT